MSSYSPPEEEETDHQFEPAQKTTDAIDEHGRLGWVSIQLDQSNYGLLLLAVFGLSIPAGLLTVGLLEIFFPEYQDFAGELLEWIGELVEGILGI